MSDAAAPPSSSFEALVVGSPSWSRCSRRRSRRRGLGAGRHRGGGCASLLAGLRRRGPAALAVGWALQVRSCRRRLRGAGDVLPRPAVRRLWVGGDRTSARKVDRLRRRPERTRRRTSAWRTPPGARLARRTAAERMQAPPRPSGSQPPMPACLEHVVTERTLVLVKPDGVARGLIGEVLAGSSARATRSWPSSCARSTATRPRQHYAEHVGQAVLRPTGGLHHLRPAARGRGRGPATPSRAGAR